MAKMGKPDTRTLRLAMLHMRLGHEHGSAVAKRLMALQSEAAFIRFFQWDGKERWTWVKDTLPLCRETKWHKDAPGAYWR